MEVTIGYIVIFFGCLLVEGFIAFVSTRGSILNEGPRSSIQYLLHIRLGIQYTKLTLKPFYFF